MQPQNATIAEGFTGLQRNVGAHALPPTASPDCSDVGLQGTQAILTTRRCRQRAYLSSSNLLGATFGVFPEGTWLYTATGDGTVVSTFSPPASSPEPPFTGGRKWNCPGVPTTQSGTGTTDGTTFLLPNGSRDLSAFGLLAFTRREDGGYEDEDEDQHDITGSVTSASAILQLRIDGVWVNFVTSTFSSATGWSQQEADILMSGIWDAVRTQATISVGTGDLSSLFDGAILGMYGPVLSTENIV